MSAASAASLVLAICCAPLIHGPDRGIRAEISVAHKCFETTSSWRGFSWWLRQVSVKLHPGAFHGLQGRIGAGRSHARGEAEEHPGGKAGRGRVGRGGAHAVVRGEAGDVDGAGAAFP